MYLSSVLSPSGEAIFTAGGDQSFKVEEFRGWVVSLEWARRRRKSLRVMVIWPAQSHLVLFGSIKPGQWAITSNVITSFVGFNRDGKCTGGGSVDLYREARAALPMLGKDVNDKQAFLSLVDAVIRFAPGLVEMPVTPRRVREKLADEAMWDVTATNKANGKTISEASI